jgi:hypothetical protein
MIRLESRKLRTTNDGRPQHGDDAVNSQADVENLQRKILFQPKRILKRSYAEIVRRGKKRE